MISPEQYGKSAQDFTRVRGCEASLIHLEDLTGKVAHASGGRAGKYSFTLGEGRLGTGYLLEREGIPTPSPFTIEVWQFVEDFAAAEAAVFIRQVDKEREPLPGTHPTECGASITGFRHSALCNGGLVPCAVCRRAAQRCMLRDGICGNCRYDKAAWGGPEGAQRAEGWFKIED